jgi:hypothetical protein
MSEEKVKSLPYVPFDTFETFIKRLKGLTTPDYITRDLMGGISGAVQTHLLTALKFFGLTGPKGETKESLYELVNAHGTDGWPSLLASVIQPAYSSTIRDFNLKNGIYKNLRERFKAGCGLDGATLDKALRFYLKALKAAGVEVSKHISTRKMPAKRVGAEGRRSSPHQSGEGPAASARNGLPGAPPPGNSGNDKQLGGFIEFPLPFKNKSMGCIRVPVDVCKEDCEVIRLTLPVIEAYAAQGGSGKNN